MARDGAVTPPKAPAADPFAADDDEFDRILKRLDDGDESAWDDYGKLSQRHKDRKAAGQQMQSITRPKGLLGF